MSKVVADLIAARALIEKPEAWTTGVLARDSCGDPTDFNGPSAVCFCVLGALARVTGDESARSGAAHLWLLAAARERHASAVTVGEANDSGGHVDALALYDWAIAALREAP